MSANETQQGCPILGLGAKRYARIQVSALIHANGLLRAQAHLQLGSLPLEAYLMRKLVRTLGRLRPLLVDYAFGGRLTSSDYAGLFGAPGCCQTACGMASCLMLW
jgi:hypothetical protein